MIKKQTSKNGRKHQGYGQKGINPWIIHPKPKTQGPLKIKFYSPSNQKQGNEKISQSKRIDSKETWQLNVIWSPPGLPEQRKYIRSTLKKSK